MKNIASAVGSFIVKSSMTVMVKTGVTCCFLAMLTMSSQAWEVFSKPVGFAVSTNLVGTNEAFYTIKYVVSAGTMTVNGQNFNASTASYTYLQPGIIPGPARFNFGSNDTAFIIYRRLQGTNFGLLVASGFMQTNYFTVPTNKVCKLFGMFGDFNCFANYGGVQQFLSLSSGTLNADRGTEIPSGVTLGFYNNAGTANQAIPYMLLDEFEQSSINGATPIPAGSVSMEIQKSTDLTNWNSVFTGEVSGEQKAFYRFKATK